MTTDLFFYFQMESRKPELKKSVVICLICVICVLFLDTKRIK